MLDVEEKENPVLPGTAFFNYSILKTTDLQTLKANSEAREGELTAVISERNRLKEKLDKQEASVIHIKTEFGSKENFLKLINFKEIIQESKNWKLLVKHVSNAISIVDVLNKAEQQGKTGKTLEIVEKIEGVRIMKVPEFKPSADFNFDNILDSLGPD